jgi:hypothetical protein
MVLEIQEKAHEKKHLGAKIIKSTLSGSCISLNRGKLLVSVIIKVMHNTTIGIFRTLKDNKYLMKI